jgi:hypothetical protein
MFFKHVFKNQDPQSIFSISPGWRKGMEDQRRDNWLSHSSGSTSTSENYLRYYNYFSAFCQKKGKSLEGIVEEYRAARELGHAEEQRFQDQWNDAIQNYATDNPGIASSVTRIYYQ